MESSKVCKIGSRRGRKGCAKDAEDKIHSPATPAFPPRPLREPKAQFSLHYLRLMMDPGKMYGILNGIQHKIVVQPVHDPGLDLRLLGDGSSRNF